MIARIVETKSYELVGLISDLDRASFETIHACALSTSKAWGGYYGFKLVCAWGLVPPTLLSDQAYLWLWTGDVEGHEFLFIRHSRLAVQRMLEEHPLIWGVVDPKNEKAKRWLAWLGAELLEPSNGWQPFQIRKAHGLRTRSA